MIPIKPGSTLWRNLHNEFVYMSDIEGYPITSLYNFKDWLELKMQCEVDLQTKGKAFVGLILNFNNVTHETWFRLKYSEYIV